MSRCTEILRRLAVVVLAGTVTNSLVPADQLSIIKTDNLIGCFDLHTAEPVWISTPSSLSGASFAVYKDVLGVYPDGWGSAAGSALYLDRSTGVPVAPFDISNRPIVARSGRSLPDPPRMDNGWQLAGYAEGYSRNLAFQASDSNPQIIWEIKTNDYPYNVVVWRDMVFFTLSPLPSEPMLFAYKRGLPGPVWRLELLPEFRSSSSSFSIRPQLAPLPMAPTPPANPTLRTDQISVNVVGGRLFVQFRGQLVSVAPGTGEVRDHINLDGKVPLAFEGGLARGASAAAVLAGDEQVLIVSYANRVVAVAQSSGRVMWHMDPDTFPHNPTPVVHGDQVYLAVGRGYGVEKPKSDAPLLLGCAIVLALTTAAIIVRSRRA